MNDILVNHIKDKLIDKNEIFDHFDYPSYDDIKNVMLVTFEVVEAECQICFFCQNHKRFGIFSQCKMKSHIQEKCYHFTMDIRKIMKNKYYKIMFKVFECDRSHNKKFSKCLSSKTKKNIIYESIKIYDIIKSYNQMLK